MSLKTSFCNKSIIKSDIRRFWWISALHTVLLFLFGVFNFVNVIRYRSFEDAAHYTQSHLFNNSFAFYFFAVVVPVILGVFLFSYLHSAKMSAFAHSIPVLRRTHYVSHIFSGLILSIAPLIINVVILLVMRTSSHISEAFKISHLLYIALGAIIYTLIAFSGSVFVSTIVANSVAALIFTFAFGALPIVAEVFWRFFISTQLYGFANTTDNLFFEFLYIAPETLLKPGSIAIYLILTLIFVISGYALYRKRALEASAEIVAFSSLRPVFIYGAAIAGGCFGFSYLNAISDVTSALALIPFGLLGIIIATMIVKKSFRVLRAVIKPLIAYVLVTLAIFVVTEFDLTGFESRIPDTGNIESVVFDLYSNRHYGRYYDTDGNPIKPVREFEPVFTEVTDISKVTELHKALAENRTQFYADTLKLTYNLKNGKTILREYPINYHKHSDCLELIVESDIIRSTYFPILRDDQRKIISLTVEYPDMSDAKKEDTAYTLPQNTITYDHEHIAEITEALKTDLRNADYSEYASRSSENVKFYLNVNFTTPFVYEDGSPVPETLLPNQHELYYIRDSYSNTINTLELLKQNTSGADIQ